MNIGSHAHYIDAGGRAHCPLIEGIAPDPGGEVDLVLYGPSPLEINSNISKNVTIQGKKNKSQPFLFLDLPLMCRM
jgi:hypothetical protein